MWFKEILLITFQFCRLGECNWNDKVKERLHDFHAIVRTVCFPRFLIETALFVLFGGSFSPSQLIHRGLRGEAGRREVRSHHRLRGEAAASAQPAQLALGRDIPHLTERWAFIGEEECQSPRKAKDWLSVTSPSLEEVVQEPETGPSAEGRQDGGCGG